jgi:DNA-binding response OmpR family regulator
MVPRVVINATAAPADPPLLSLLESEGFDLVACPDAHAMLEEVMLRVPDAVIYALRADCREDLGVLRLLRRAAPDVPLVLLASEDSLDTRKVTQSLRPIYYAVSPLDGAELREVMRTAVSRRGRAS